MIEYYVIPTHITKEEAQIMFPEKPDDWQEKRKAFMQDLYHLLETYQRFVDDPTWEENEKSKD
jgi:hypothetical protein